MTKGFSNETIRTIASIVSGMVGSKLLLQHMGKDPGGLRFVTANYLTQTTTWDGIQSRVITNMISLLVFFGLAYVFIR